MISNNKAHATSVALTPNQAYGSVGKKEEHVDTKEEEEGDDPDYI